MPSRPDFWGIEPEWVHYLIYVVLTLTLLFMLARVYVRASLWWKVGRPPGRFSEWGKRFGRLLNQALVQQRILSQPYAGLMHVLIAWSMFVLFLGTPVGVFNAYVFPGFLKGNLFLFFKLVMDLCVITFLVGAVMAAIRRYIIRPDKLTFEKRFGWSLLLLTLIVMTGPLVEGTRLAVLSLEDNITYGGWMPVGWMVAGWYLAAGSTVAELYTWHTVFYYFHMGLVIVLFLTLPVGNLLHIITTPLSVFFSSFEPQGRLAAVQEDEDANPVFGDRLDHLTWKQLMDGDACTECGRCQEVCPAYTVGFELNPKQLVLNLRAALQRDGESLVKGREPSVPLIGGDVPTNMLWACTTCAACVQACPAFIDHISDVVTMRRHLVYEGEVDELLQTSLANLGRYGNSFGKSARMRAAWAKELDFEIKNANREAVEYLWFVGDYASFSPTLTGVTQMVARVLQTAAVDFGMLFDSERNAGNDVRRVGEEGLFEELVEKNCKVLQKADFKAIVTTDPHTYNTLKNEYPQDVIAGRPILHYSELLLQLLDEGRLFFTRGLGLTVTYHDPCYLARYNDIYDAPRKVIWSTGCRLVEMPRSHSNGFCCGAGGGRIYLDEGVVQERPSENRIREAAALSGVSAMVVSCPKDITMFQDALKTTSLDDQLQVKDLIELVYEAL